MLGLYHAIYNCKVSEIQVNLLYKGNADGPPYKLRHSVIFIL